MGHHAQFARMLDATFPPIARPVSLDIRLHRILARPETTWTPDEISYVAGVEARADENERRWAAEEMEQSNDSTR